MKNNLRNLWVFFSTSNKMHDQLQKASVHDGAGHRLFMTPGGGKMTL